MDEGSIASGVVMPFALSESESEYFTRGVEQQAPASCLPYWAVLLCNKRNDRKGHRHIMVAYDCDMLYTKE